MTDIEIIEKCLKANKPSDIFTSNWKKEYLSYSRLIHPDHCSQMNASDAMAKLNYLKDLIVNGAEMLDDTGKYFLFENRIEYVVDDKNKKQLKKSYENYQLIKKQVVGNKKNFSNYLPEKMEFVNDRFIVFFSKRSLPLCGKELPQKHVNWIFSRIFEFCLFIQQSNFSHLGINPETIFVVPETHGIVCTSFYHMTPLSKKVKTVSSRYRNWYPTSLFSEKKAMPDIDLELAKKIAIYLLGDKSGAGTKLKRNGDINQEILNFLLSKHSCVFNDYDNYRKLLDKFFKKEFIVLNL